ncbi:MAG: HIT family protein [Oxalobacter sp.]|nr:MAG: HIT family protein [Oxalobacter sp.]
MNTPCELCQQNGGELIIRTTQWRIILVNDANYPGFCRVIWNDHVREMTDLSSADRAELMRVVLEVESVVREIMQPEKINLASLGNVVPHLHWHVIPRYLDDAHFPAPVWAEVKRVASPESLATRSARLPALRAAMIERIRAT